MVSDVLKIKHISSFNKTLVIFDPYLTNIFALKMPSASYVCYIHSSAIQNSLNHRSKHYER